MLTVKKVLRNLQKTKVKTLDFQMVRRFVAYTDGACKGNNLKDQQQQLAGSGIVIFTSRHLDVLEDIFERRHGSKTTAYWRKMVVDRTDPFQGAVTRSICIPATKKTQKLTNNRAELYAFNGVLAYFLAIESEETLHITIKVDSKYVKTTFENAPKWSENNFKTTAGTLVKNLDYVKEMLLYIDALKSFGACIETVHVPAHKNEKIASKCSQEWIDWFGNDMADRLSNIGTGIVSDINYDESKLNFNKRSRSKPSTTCPNKKRKT